MSDESKAAKGATVVESAWAKINLTPQITGRRADGYHELESAVVFADVGDVLAIDATDANSLTLTIEGPFAAPLLNEKDNLVLRAAAALRKHAGIEAGAAITLTKNLPVASGIGGGSADAAAALRGLSRLWQLDLLLVNPGVAVSTSAVFSSLAGSFSEAREPRLPPAGPAAFIDWLTLRGNDLQVPACRLAPAVTEVLAALDDMDDCLLARMSGSGATCFGLFENEAAARAAAAALAETHPEWWVAPALLRA